jgi:putative oxidoreductase
MSSIDTGLEPRPLIPRLGSLYQAAGPWHWPLIRATVGGMLLAHGWPKLMMGAQAVAANTLARRGIEPALAFAYVLIVLETVGALLIMLGLFTRPVAVALVLEFAVIIYQHAPNGFAWINRGYEYPLFWGLIFLAIALRGGGPYSLDRALRREI